MKAILKKAIPATVAFMIIINVFAVLPVSASFSFSFGDIDTDGNITAADARTALRYSVALEYYTLGHLILGDTDCDGKITAADARNILRYSVELDAPPYDLVTVEEADFEEYINKPSADPLFQWVLPDSPEVNAPSGTFTFTVYGYGHGVGLSQYGVLSLEDGGYTYDRILSHYYTGTEIMLLEEFPEKTLYVGEEHPTLELLTRIVYQEIYGITENGRYKESLKAMILCVFSNLAYFDFNVKRDWDVGVASPLTYEEMPENLKKLVTEVAGQYICVKGSDKPVQAVYSGLAAGMTASSESIWGGSLSHLTAVPSPFDMLRPGFITQKTYTVEEMLTLITEYDEENTSFDITLGEDPSSWLMILEHTGSMDETRGYVTKIRVGDTVLKGYNQFLVGLMNNSLRSPCFTITYTP